MIFPVTPDGCSRRRFIAKLGAAAAASAIGSLAAAAPPPPLRYKIGGFTKPFQNLSFEATAEMAASVGWDGVEIPVRRGGQILPERVEADLPRLAAVLRAHGLEVMTLATDIRNASDPGVERLLRTAASLGITTYRLGASFYDLDRPIAPQLGRIRSGLAELQSLNRELGLCAVYENHSGTNYFGAPIWDIVEVMRGWDPREFGVCLDVGHATIEGGLDWAVQFRLVEPMLRAVYVKDFVWKKTKKGWDAVWCPLGEGMLSPNIFAMLLRSEFRGPIIQHHEYPLGSLRSMRTAMRRDLATLRRWLVS